MPRLPSDSLPPRPATSQQQRDSALLKATTELYCQAAQNDRDAARRYEELALHLLPKVSLAVRMEVAERLAARADAPLAVVMALAADEPTTAAPFLARSPVLRPIDLLAIIARTGPAHHRVIARRGRLPADVEAALRRTADAEMLAILGPSPAPAPAPRIAAGDLAEADAIAAHAVEGFLSLSRPDRLRLIATIAGRGGEPADGESQSLDQVVRNAYRVAQIPGFARSRNRAGLIDAIATIVRMEPALVARLVDDPSGEALVLLLRATGLSDADARTVLLLANPAIGESVEAFTRAADLFTGVEPAVAESFVAAWRPKPVRPEPRHQPLVADIAPARGRAASPADRPAAAPAELPEKIARKA